MELYLFLAVTIFIVACLKYKSLLNPLGTFVPIWLVILYLYHLKLSTLLTDISAVTHLLVISALISFTIGCLLIGNKITPVKYVNIRKNKILSFYILFLFIAIVEMKLRTPPMLAENKVAAYMDERGIGLPFLHFAVMLLPVAYGFMLLHKEFSIRTKIVAIIPPLLIIAVWMQRGLFIWFIFFIMTVVIQKTPIKKHLIWISAIIIIIVLANNVIGTSRSTGNDYAKDYINKVSQMTIDLPPSLVWLYIYPTSALNNFDQVVKNNNISYLYGYDLIAPVVSLFQLKRAYNYVFDPEINEELDFEVLSGFNVPSMFYWCYKNLSYTGMILFPFMLGCISQVLFNKYMSRQTLGTIWYGIWYPNLIYSFHDFLFWNSPMLMVFIVSLLIYYKVSVRGKNKISEDVMLRTSLKESP